jgi:hypothetical protein
MKQIILICVLLVAVLIPSNYIFEQEDVNAAGLCAPPTCFEIPNARRCFVAPYDCGHVVIDVSKFRKGTYLSKGMCALDVVYYTNYADDEGVMWKYRNANRNNYTKITIGYYPYGLSFDNYMKLTMLLRTSTTSCKQFRWVSL